MKELQTLQGHSRDVLSAEWHPIHEDVSQEYRGILWQATIYKTEI
jgi:hypothetical protein